MKQAHIKRLIVIVLLGVMMITGCSSGKSTTLGPDNPITFSWLVYDRVEGKVLDDWEIFKEIEAKTGVKVKFQVVSQDGLDEKRQIMIATNTATDFIQINTQDGREHGPDKVFLNLKDYLDKAPNLKAFYDNYPEAKALATGSDGGLYTVPVLEGDAAGKGFNFIWYARKDILDKHGIKAPTTVDGFYDFLKALKAQYPDSYPLISNGIVGDTGLYTTFGRIFTGIHGFYNIDPLTDQYAFAPNQPGYQEMLVFLNKLYSEKLLDPEYSLLTQAQWEERILTGKSMVTYFWKADLESLVDKARKAGTAEYDLDAIPLFAAEGIKNYQYSRPIVGTVGRAISAKVKDKDRAVQFLDYLIGDEGSNYLSLGIEGKTYTMENGKAVYNREFGTSPFATLRKDWGVWYDLITLNNAKSREVWERGLSEKSLAINAGYEQYIIPSPKQIVKTVEELELEKSKLNNVNKFLEQKITEFVTGKIPINDETYKQFVDQAKKLGSEELLTMYNEAYTRTYSK
ncbi:putative aldouronate transport system substrate-binding protein [Paenibacillus castaneae]|nr:extracellular solute-binding protein [Paenibacillus castaneae]NIK75061.1 putative aldouronate transport system substrate-binding protein [Paenibacillus castaneae]